MTKFTLKLNKFAAGTVKIYNLLINEVDQFEVFEEELEDLNKPQFKSIGATIYQISDNTKPPPKGKRRQIKGIKGAVEIRTKNLRLYYLVIKEHDLIICIGGLKTKQKKDLRRLKTLKEEIENQIEQHGKLKIK